MDTFSVETTKHVVNLTSVICTSPTNDTVNSRESAGVDANTACKGTGVDSCTGNKPSHLGRGHGGLRPLKDAKVPTKIVEKYGHETCAPKVAEEAN